MNVNIRFMKKIYSILLILLIGLADLAFFDAIGITPGRLMAQTGTGRAPVASPLDIEPPLIKAIRANDLAEVKKLAGSGADIDCADQTGTPALMVAVDENRREIARFLIEKGARFAVSKKGVPLVCELAMHGDTGTVLLAAKKGADICAADASGVTPLMNAVLWSGIEMTGLLIELKASVNARDREGETALLKAVRNKKFSEAVILLDKSAEVEVYEKGTGRGVLHFAIENRAPAALIEKILDRRPALNRPMSSNFSTVMQTAVSANLDARLFKRMLDMGAPVSSDSGMGDDPAFYAVDDPVKIELLRALVDKGAKLDGTDAFGISLYARAASFGNIQAMKLLKEHGAPAEPACQGDLDAFLAAAVAAVDTSEIATMLKKGASPDSSISYLDSGMVRTEKLLCRAVKMRYYDAAKLLIEAGAARCATSFADSDPFENAVMNDDGRMVELFLKSAIIRPISESDLAKALFTGLRHGSKRSVDAFFSNGVSVDVRGNRKNTPLIEAASFDRSGETVKMLIRRGANVNASNEDGDTALIVAARYGNRKAVEELLKHKAAAAAKNNKGRTALDAVRLAISECRENGYDRDGKKSLEEIEKLLYAAAPSGASCDTKVNTKLMRTAITKGDLAAVKKMIESGANVNDTSENGTAPLELAIYSPDPTGAVSLLLKNGADATTRGRDGAGLFSMCFSHARREKKASPPNAGYEVALMLVNKGATVDGAAREAFINCAGVPENYLIMKYMLNRKTVDVNAYSLGCEKALINAVSNSDNYATVDMLMKNGADVNLVDIDWSTALMKAAARASNEVTVKRLITAGARVNAKNFKGGTALMAAAEHGSPSMISLLLKSGAAADDTDNDGNTALMRVTARDFSPRYEKIKLLIESTKDPDRVNNAGESALLKLLKRASRRDLYDFRPIADLIRRGAKADLNDHFVIDGLLVAFVDLNDVGKARSYLKKGANIKRACDSYKTHLLTKAVENCGLEMVRLLYENGAPPIFKMDGYYGSQDAFIEAVRRQKFDMVSFFLTSDGGFSKYPSRNEAADIVMNYADHDRYMKLFVKHGWNPRYADANGNSIFHRSPRVACATAEKIEYLKKLGADVNAVNRACETPLFTAEAIHDFNALKLLIDSGCDPRIARKNGDTIADRLSIRHSDLGCRLAVRARGARPKYDDRSKLDKMLICAVSSGDTFEVAALLDRGADPRAHVDGFITTAYYSAFSGPSPEVLMMFIDRYGKPEYDRDFYERCLVPAVSAGRAGTVKLLIENGASPDYRCSPTGFRPKGAAEAGLAGDETFLEKAVTSRSSEMVAYLIDKLGGRVDHSALLLRSMALRPSLAVARELVKRGADVNARDKLGRNSLMAAFATEYDGFGRSFNSIEKELIDFIISEGLDLSAKDASGRTLQDYIGAWYFDRDVADHAKKAIEKALSKKGAVASDRSGRVKKRSK